MSNSLRYTQNDTIMIKNDILIAIRLFFRNPIHTVVNVLGLTLGLSTSILVWIYVSNETSFDRFNERSEDIYRIKYDNYYQGAYIYSSATAFPALGGVLKEEFAQVEETTKLFHLYGAHSVRYENGATNSNAVYFAEQSFFEVFNFNVLAGNPDRLLSDAGSAVITSEIAENTFGKLDVIGETMTIGRGIRVAVSGVVEARKDSHIAYDILVSYPTGVQIWGEEFQSDWDWSFFHVYLKLKEGFTPKEIDNAFPKLIEKYKGEGANATTKLSLQPLHDIHLDSNLLYEFKVNGSAQNVMIILIAGVSTLLLAWINFINLLSAKALSRVKEIGVKKIHGAQKTGLIRQFMVETLMVSTIALLLAILLVDISLPFFNQYSAGAFYLNSGTLPSLVGIMFLCYIGGSFLAAVYPAFIISSKKIADIMDGKFKYSNLGLLSRRILIILQFTLSSFLIGGMLVAQSQIDFMLSKEKGVDTNNTIVLNAPTAANDSVYFNHLDVFRNELMSLPNVKSFSTSSEIPGNNIFYWVQETNFNNNQADKRLLYTIDVDHTYLKSFDHNLLAGRLFEEGQDEFENLILTQKAAEELGYYSPEDAVGARVYIEDYDSLSVIGVVSNYHQQGMQNDYAAIAFYCDPEFHLYYSIKIDGENITEELGTIEDAYARLFPDNHFDYFFLDDSYNQQYTSEFQFNWIFSLFSLLSLFVSSIGILGLVVVSITQRQKEIGIRKILGAGVVTIISAISKKFLRLILIANIISFPLIYYWANMWLDNFQNHIEISVSIFFITFSITLAVAFLTIIYRTVMAAVQNPINTVRSE